MSAKSGSLSIVHVPQKLSVIWSRGVSAIQGLLKYWCEQKDSRDFQYIMGVRYSGESVKQGSTEIVRS